MAKSKDAFSKYLLQKVDYAKKETLSELQDDIETFFDVAKEATPVDTGELKASWDMRIKEAETQLVIKFDSDAPSGHSKSILLLGRRYENGKWEGSTKLPDGILPIIYNFKKILKAKYGSKR